MKSILPIYAVVIMLTVCSAPSHAQIYQRHWNTAVVPPAVSTITTSSLQRTPLPTPFGPLVYHGQTGLASYYWQGQKTASGEQFDRNALTAAHRSLPMNTMVKVIHAENGRSVIVRINDRGPFKPGRIIDVSDRAADILGLKKKGLGMVRLEIMRN